MMLGLMANLFQRGFSCKVHLLPPYPGVFIKAVCTLATLWWAWRTSECQVDRTVWEMGGNQTEERARKMQSFFLEKNARLCGFVHIHFYRHGSGCDGSGWWRHSCFCSSFCVLSFQSWGSSAAGFVSLVLTSWAFRPALLCPQEVTRKFAVYVPLPWLPLW